jgi:hypothetical protein
MESMEDHGECVIPLMVLHALHVSMLLKNQ